MTMVLELINTVFVIGSESIVVRFEFGPVRHVSQCLAVLDESLALSPSRDGE